jgi:hypothetical protein
LTSSGTYTAGYQYDDILTDAWERISKPPQIMTDDVILSARRSLNFLLIDWTNRGVPLWQIEGVTATLAPGTGVYTMPTYVVDVLDISIEVQPHITRILSRISRSNYAAISNKTLVAPPTQVHVNRQVPAIRLEFYPVPDQAYVMTANVLRQPQDVSGLLDTPDAPLLWTEALVSGLAARLAEKFAPDRLAEKQALAKEAWAAAYGEERERVPLVIRPDFGGWR